MLPAGTGNSDWKHYASKHAVKVKSRVRKGIPDRLRGVAWQLLSGGRDLLLQNEGPHSASINKSLERSRRVSARADVLDDVCYHAQASCL